MSLALGMFDILMVMAVMANHMHIVLSRNKQHTKYWPGIVFKFMW